MIDCCSQCKINTQKYYEKYLILAYGVLLQKIIRITYAQIYQINEENKINRDFFILLFNRDWQ